MKKVKIIAIFLITIITLGINYTFYKPAKFNSMIAAKLYKEPANSSFKDDKFYQCVVDSYNKENNTSHPYTYNLSDEELKKITELDCSDKGLIDTTGIEKLTSLAKLELYGNKLTKLDVSKNTLLKYLDTTGNQLTELDVSNNILLVDLIIWNNKLTKLDISKNLELEYLDVEENQLTYLNVGNNIKLKELYIGYNNLSQIDISKNTSLEYLSAYCNNLTQINISNNIKLKGLDVEYNNLTQLDARNNSLLTELYIIGTNIDKFWFYDSIDYSILSEFFSEKKLLKYLNLGNNKIINLNNDYNYYFNDHIQIKNSNTTIPSFINNLGLTNLNAKIYDGNVEKQEGTISYGNILKIFDQEGNLIDEVLITILNNTYFKDARLYRCVVDEYNDINDTNYPYTYNLSDEELKTITSLSCPYSNIKNAEGIEKLTSLIELDLSSNQLTKLNINSNVNLKNLYLGYNYLNQLDVNNNVNLEELNLSNNFFLTQLNISNNSLLKRLDVSQCQLTKLDVTNNTKLYYLNVVWNLITQLDVSQNSDLIYLYVDYNDLSQLNVSNNLKLQYLYARSNDLTNLDVSNNLELKELRIESNKLTSLDVSDNLKLQYLHVYNNNLTRLDVGNNTALKDLKISGNPFKEEIYLYKGKNSITTIGNNVKLPSHLNWNSPTWTIQDKNIATIDENKKVIGMKSGTVDIKGILGGKYTITTTVHVVEITSDKYTINEENSNIYIGTTKNLENVKNNINVSNNNVKLEINDNKLQVKYNDEVLKEFKFIQIDFGKFKSSDEIVSIIENTEYEEFIDNIKVSNGLAYKIFKGDEEITSGTLEKGMILKLYYNDKEIDGFKITDEYLEIDESIEIDGEYFTNIRTNTTVASILSKIDTSGEIIVKNKNGNQITNNDLIGTGSTVSIELSEGEFEYTIIIYGDIDGDGTIKLPDVMKIANYVYKDKESLKDAYLIAADYDKNGRYGLSDIMGTARTLYN